MKLNYKVRFFKWQIQWQYQKSMAMAISKINSNFKNQISLLMLKNNGNFKKQLQSQWQYQSPKITLNINPQVYKQY